MSTSLFNRRLRWTDVARLLGIEFESHSLPTLVTCPLCTGRDLRVYEDTSARGAWFHCAGCGAGGDGVSFPAAVWGVDPAAAVERLIMADLLVPADREQVAVYVKMHADRHARMSAFWAAAKSNLPAPASPDVARLTRIVGLNTDLSPERWRKGLGELVGAAERTAVERVFHPDRYFKYRACDTTSRVFKGRGWTDVLVLPYTSSQARISGFSFVGKRAGDGRVYAAVRCRGSTFAHDAGLYAVQGADGYAAVVAVPDELLALKLHSRHAATSGRFLNLIGWRDDGAMATGRASWQQVNGKRVVHWVRQLDAAVIRQAHYFDADISTAGPERKGEEFDHYCRLVDPPDLMRRVVRLARPWRYALADWVREANGVAVEVLAKRLDSFGIDPHEVARSLPDREAADLMHELAGGGRVGPGVRFVNYDYGKVEARPDGWFFVSPVHARRQSCRVSNFTIGINRIHVLPDGERYDCDVHFQGRTYPVELTGDTPVARQLLRAGVGVVYVHPRWAERLLPLAAAFDPPAIVR